MPGERCHLHTSSPVVRACGTIRASAVLLAALALASAGCSRFRPVVVDLPSGTPLEHAGTSVSSAFGGAFPGRSYWLSRNGRYALLYEWREDTNGDGRVSIRIGYHGSMLGDEPRPYLVDIATGATTGYDEFLSTLDGRWIALRTGQTVTLVDAETGARRDLTAGLDLAPADSNDCAGPRSLVFDHAGRRVGLLYGDPARFLVRDLLDDRSWEVRGGTDVLWRARFSGTDDVVYLFLVPADSARADTASGLPRLSTTCVNRFGTLFAFSYSSQGWRGPPFYVSVVAPTGKRLRFARPPFVLSRSLVALGDTALSTMSGHRVPLPAGCSRFDVAIGSPEILLHCGLQVRLFDPARRSMLPLPKPVRLMDRAVGVPDAGGRTWLPVLVPDTENGINPVHRIARLRVGDGRLEVGPIVASDAVFRGGWIVGRGNDSLHVIDVATGRHFTAPINPSIPSLGFPGIWQRNGPRILLDPVDGRYVEVEQIGAQNDRGCYLEASGTVQGSEGGRGVRRGPWRRRCATASPSVNATPPPDRPPTEAGNPRR